MPELCKGGGCPKKIECYRHTAKPMSRRQSYFLTPPFRITEQGVACEHYWPVVTDSPSE